jgi:hypothetical protein
MFLFEFDGKDTMVYHLPLITLSVSLFLVEELKEERRKRKVGASGWKWLWGEMHNLILCVTQLH